jgi:hypothetical protein
MAGGGGTSDTTPPTVGFSSPTNGATVFGTVSVVVSASDNVGVASVSVSVDGALVGTDTAAPYNFSCDTPTLSDGAHTLTATAADAVGNTATTSISVAVSNSAADTTPPTVSITSPANGSGVSGRVSVYVNAWDNSAVAKVELYVDGRLKDSSTSAPFTTKWNSRREAAGTHILQSKVYDAAGNAGMSVAITVYK